jgi:hypothetical protein
MNASANPSAVLSSSDGVREKGLMRRTTAKPQQRFADVPVLAGLQEKTKPDKGTADKATVHLGPESQQGTPETHKRSNRSVPDSGQAATGTGLPDQSAVLLVQPQSNIVNADSPSKSFPKNAGRKREDGDQGTKGEEQKQSPSPVSQESLPQDTLIGPVGCWCAVHTQPSQNTPSPKEGLSDVAAHATGNRVAARPDEAQAEVSQPVPAGMGRQVLQQPQKEGKESATASAETELGKAEHKEQEVTAGESTEKPQRARAGGNEVPTSVGSKATFTPAPVPADRPSVTIANPDQAPPKAPLASREAAVQAPEGPQRGTAALRTESQQRTTPRRDDTPGARNRPLEVDGPGDKKTPSSQRKEGATVPTEPPASLAGQPVVATPRLSLEAQTHKVAEVGATANPIRSVGEQILDSVRAATTPGDRQIVIRLQPPELGTVAVRLREQGDHLEGTIEVGRSDVRREIEQALPDMVRGLQEAGVPIRRFDVTSSDSAGPDLGRGLSQQDVGAGQHGSGQTRDHFRPLHTSWPGQTADHSVESHETSSPDRRISTADGRIDVLL